MVYAIYPVFHLPILYITYQMQITNPVTLAHVRV